MKLEVTLSRTVKVPVDHLKMAAGWNNGGALSIEESLRKRFGILAPLLKIYIHEDVESYTGHAFISMEVMRFSLKDPKIPTASIITADPVSYENALMTDGALSSELARLGIEIDTRTIEWSMAYSVSGN